MRRLAKQRMSCQSPREPFITDARSTALRAILDTHAVPSRRQLGDSNVDRLSASAAEVTQVHQPTPPTASSSRAVNSPLGKCSGQLGSAACLSDLPPSFGVYFDGHETITMTMDHLP
jgi:hypothetical protein